MYILNKFCLLLRVSAITLTFVTPLYAGGDDDNKDATVAVTEKTDEATDVARRAWSVLMNRVMSVVDPFGNLPIIVDSSSEENVAARDMEEQILWNDVVDMFSQFFSDEVEE